MSLLRLLPLAVIPALLAACIDNPIEITCNRTEFSVASTSGDTVTTTTGLRYIEERTGTGALVEWCEPVRIHYTGYLLDGTEFDTSRGSIAPLRFRPGYSGLIDGMEQGVIGMRENGTRRLIIPPELAYGSVPQRRPDGTIVIPANSTLIFDVEIIGVGD